MEMVIDRQEIFRMIKEGRTALMMGGDIELYEGMRTDAEIITHLANACSYPENFPKSLPEVCEHFAERNGKSMLLENLIRLFEIRPGNSPLLKSLAEVKAIEDIFTTRMDECLKDYFPQEELAVVRSDIDVPRALMSKRRFYYLNGTTVNSQYSVITKTDLVNRLSNGLKSSMIIHLAYNLTLRHFLIIGHDLNEWNFSFYFNLVTKELGEFRQKAVLFCSNPNPVLARDWSKKNIEVLPEDPKSFFSDYLTWEQQQ